MIVAGICSIGIAVVIVLILILLGVIGPNSKKNKYEGICPADINTCIEIDGQECPNVFYVEDKNNEKSCLTCQKLFPSCQECIISSEEKSAYELLDVEDGLTRNKYVTCSKCKDGFLGKESLKDQYPDIDIY